MKLRGGICKNTKYISEIQLDQPSKAIMRQGPAKGKKLLVFRNWEEFNF